MIAESSPFPWFSTARRRTRRIVVAVYWLVFFGLFGRYEWKLAFLSSHIRAELMLLPMYLIVLLPGILGGVRLGGIVKPFGKVRWIPPLYETNGTLTLFKRPQKLGSFSAQDMTLDERDVNDRDRVHYFAYTASRWLALALLFAQIGAGLASSVWLQRIGAASFVLLAMVLWSLPQSIILWTESDVEEPQ